MSAAICPARGSLSVEMTNPIAIPSYRAQKIQIDGEPFQDNQPYREAVGLEVPKLPGRAYTISIGDGITDIYGQPMVGARTLAFTTTLERFEPMMSGRTGLFILDPRFEIPQWVLSTQAVTQLRVQLYRVQPADYFAYTKFEADPKAAPPGKRVFDKTYPVGARTGAELRVDLRPALSATSTGHVIAIATAEPSVRVPEWFNRRSVAWIEVSRLGMSARVDGDKISAWAADISPDHFLAPIGNLASSLLVEGKPGASAQGTADGMGHVMFDLPARVPVNPKAVVRQTPASLLVMQSPTDSVFTAVGSYERAIRTESALWYVTDDRFTYKPGEPLYIKGWVRWTHDGVNPDLSLPKPGETVAFALKDARGNKIAEGSSQLTDQGGFDFQIALPPNANLGTARLALVTRDQSYVHPISIQEFRAPAYSVTLDDDVAHSGAIPVVLGESIEMNATAKYYSGGGLGGADIRWDAELATTRFSPAGWDPFHFDPIRKRSARFYYWRSGADDPEPIRVHQEGSLSGASNASIVYGLAALPAGRPALLSVDSTVTDVDRMNIRASSRPILVHPSAYYVGVRQKPAREQRLLLVAETEDQLELIVTDLDGAPVKGVPIKVEIEGVLGSEMERDDAKVIETQSCDLVSAATPITCGFTRKDLMTAYTAVARIADTRGRVNVAQYDIPWWSSSDRRDLSIVPDRAHYKPGDKAKLEIKSKVLPATALVSFARGGLISQQRIELTKESTFVELPIEPSFIQNVHVLVDRWGKRKQLLPGSTLPLYWRYRRR